MTNLEALLARVAQLEAQLNPSAPPSLPPIGFEAEARITQPLATLVGGPELGYIHRDIRTVQQLIQALAVSYGVNAPRQHVPKLWLEPLRRLAAARASGLAWRAALTEAGFDFITSGAGGANPPQPSDAVLTFQPSTNDVRHSSLAVLGTDLYASTIDGRIVRYPIANDGSLGAAEQLTALTDPDGNNRLTVGFAFDPTATPENPVAWVSSAGFTGFAEGGGIYNGNVAYRWASKITRLSGPNLATQQDVVVGLPRSSKDHVTNSIAFNPAEPGVLYFNQGSNTAMGAPDTNWRFQPERVLSGAVLRLDYAAVGSGTLNVKTEDGGTYNPYADGAPLTVYASGTRNAYDLAWHSNGHLYVPANGSAANGNMPSYDPLPGTCENRPDGSYTGEQLVGESALPNLRYITSGVDPTGVTVPVNGWTIPQTMNDYLFDIEEGGYYGTPNPKRCEWILFGGGVGTGDGDDKINALPASVEPDPNYQGYAYNFGQNISPNGAIEYKCDAFSRFKGQLMVVRYNSGDNIVALGFDGSGNVSGEAQPVVGSNSFADPIDLTEDPRTGYSTSRPTTRPKRAHCLLASRWCARTKAALNTRSPRFSGASCWSTRPFLLPLFGVRV